MVNRSAFGLARVCNLLPQGLVDSTAVSTVNVEMQHIIKQMTVHCCFGWADTFSLRLPLVVHLAKIL